MSRRCVERVLLCVVLLLCVCALAQNEPTVQPVLIDYRIGNQVYVGFQHNWIDYRLQTGETTTRAEGSGFDAQYRVKEFGKIGVLGSARMSSGSPLGQKLLTVAGGASFSFPMRRYRPFTQALLGYSRVTSKDDMYLTKGSSNGLTTLLGIGVDIDVSHHWGVRPLYLENQYVTVGSNGKGSFAWNVGGGLTYRFKEIFSEK